MFTYISKIGHQWAVSCKLFTLANLKLMGLVTLNAAVGIYATFMRYCWWAIVITFFLLSYRFSLGIFDCVMSYLIFLVVSAARSSVGLKNSAYFFEKSIIFPVYYVLHLGMNWVALFFVALAGLSPIGVVMALSLTRLLEILTLFFMLDSYPSVHAFLRIPGNVVRMFIYNFPVFLVIGLLSGMLFWISDWIALYSITLFHIKTVFLGVLFLCIMIFMPLYCALIANLYIRFAYENIKVYFPIK